MKFAGNVTAVLGQRLLVAQSDAGQLPPLYAEVANSREEPVGTIVDLYGSVAHPYLTILCRNGAKAEAGEALYVLPGSAPEKKPRYTGQNRRPKSGGPIQWKQKSRS
jgi:rRNA processing protein Gar1